MSAVTRPRLPPYDDALGLYPLFFTVPATEANYVKIIFESYESFGVIRSQDPRFTDERVLMVLLLVADMTAPALEVAGELADEARLEFLEPTAGMLADLRRHLLG
jgi:hypothetical protein